MEKKFTVTELCASLDESYEVTGPKDTLVTNLMPIDKSTESSITFCSNTDKDDAKKMISSSKAYVVICSYSCGFGNSDFQNKTIISVENPRKTFIKLMKNLFIEEVQYEISSNAIIEKGAEIHPEVFIGPNTYIGGQVKIGPRTIIHANVSIYDGTKIGTNVVIHSGTVIGASGFGYEREDNGEFLAFPHMGGVLIEDDVEIGANTCIDRGTLGDTTIGKGTKIDNLCHIAHNVEIGKHSAIIALTLIGGSTKIGDYSWVAPCACVRDGLRIGKNTILGMGTVVTKDVEDNAIVLGIPGKKVKDNPIPTYLSNKKSEEIE